MAGWLSVGQSPGCSKPRSPFAGSRVIGSSPPFSGYWNHASHRLEAEHRLRKSRRMSSTIAVADQRKSGHRLPGLRIKIPPCGSRVIARHGLEQANDLTRTEMERAP